MADFFQEFKKRRILPALGVYAGGSWALIEVLDWLVNHYLLSPHLTEIAFWGLLSLIPAVVLIAWTHGRPGKDRHTMAEKAGVFINIALTLGLLTVFFGDKNLGAVASMHTVTNEEGVQETHYIPSDNFRRRMAVFFFENESGDPELDWLQYGVTDLLVQDLQQNPFVLATSPWNNYANGYYSRMRQAGFKDGLGIPRSLMREIAEDANRQYFVEGSINSVSDEYQVTARIWETRSMQMVDELTQKGWDLYSTVDALSVEVRDALDVPHGDERFGVDLLLADTYGESSTAFKSYISGLNARLFDNDFDASNAFFDAAIEADSAFVLAWFLKSINLIDAGDLPSSQAAIQKAQELDYRLPDRDRVTLKAMRYRLSGQQEKLIAFWRMQVQLRDDARSHQSLAFMLKATGEIEEAKLSYLAAIEKDPLSVGIYLQLSILERATSNPEVAIDYAKRYQAEKPEDIEAYLTLGDFLQDNGEFDTAQEYYLQASLLDNAPLQPLLRMSNLAARSGNTDAARELLAQAEDTAKTPMDQGLVRQAAASLERRLGRIHAAIEQLYRQGENLRQTGPTFQVATAVYMPIVYNYVSLGDHTNAEAVLDKAREMAKPPLDKLLAFAEASLLLDKGNIDGAQLALGRAEELIELFKFEDLRPYVHMERGFIQRQQGDYSGSVTSFRAAREKSQRLVHSGSEGYAMILPVCNAELAKSLVLSGDLDGAEEALNQGFLMDPEEPLLWVTKARHQLASGQPQLAQTSVSHALVIWKDADPQYTEYKQARELETEIRQAL